MFISFSGRLEEDVEDEWQEVEILQSVINLVQ